MRIGIDIDDTITETYDCVYNLAQEFIINNLGKEPKLDKSIELNTHHYTRALFEFNPEEEHEFWSKYYKELVDNVVPKALAPEYLRKLKSEGHELVLITARFETDDFDVKTSTEEWLKKYNIPFDKLIVNGDKEKGTVAELEGLDLFIDDSFSNCQSVTSKGIKSFVMESKTNKGLAQDNIKRVYSWPHIYMLLDK